MKTAPNFFQPVISTIGLAVSLIVSVLPLFNNALLSDLFINSQISTLTAFLAFILSLPLIWHIVEFQPFIQPKMWKWQMTNPYQMIWILIPITIICAFGFLYLGIAYSGSENNLLQTVQALGYLFFFLFLVSIFAFLFAHTKMKFQNEEDKERFPITIFETLERNRIIRPHIEIQENRWIPSDELIREGLTMTLGPCRKVRVETVPQKREIIEFIISSEGKEFVKMVKRHEITD
jgi:hypothetical protein